MLPTPDPELTEAEIRRYARHIVLPELGGIGQRRVKAARVLVIGAGGLGAPLLLYLAAAGVGRLGVVDDDTVSVSNLQRQVVFDSAAEGMPKTAAARRRLEALNPAIAVVTHEVRLTADNADGIVAPYDLVADGSDSFATRDVVQAACRRLGRTLVSGAVQGAEGQLTTFKPHLGPPHPCLRCLFPDAPDAGSLPSCAAGGVLGPVAGVVGTLQAVEVVKELVGLGEGLSGLLLSYDGLSARLDRMRVARDRRCPGPRCRLDQADG